MSTTVPQPERTKPALQTYKAAVVHEFRSPLTVEQVLKPELGPGQVLVQVGLGALSHRHPRRPRRLAGEA